MPSADNLCKQFRPRSGQTECRAWSGSKLFDTLMVFQKEFFKKVDFEKNQQTTIKHAKLPRMQSVNLPCMFWNDGTVFCKNTSGMFLSEHIWTKWAPFAAAASVISPLLPTIPTRYLKIHRIISKTVLFSMVFTEHWDSWPRNKTFTGK